MKFRGEETTKLVNLIVKGISLSVVFTGGFFGTPLSFLYTALQEHTTSRRSINRNQNSAAIHFFLRTSMYLLINAGNCDLNDNISSWIVEQ